MTGVPESSCTRIRPWETASQMYCDVSGLGIPFSRFEVHRRALDQDADGDDSGERATLVERAPRCGLGRVGQIEQRRLSSSGLYLRASD